MSLFRWFFGIPKKIDYVEMFTNVKGVWHWRGMSSNGEKVCASEPYEGGKSSCKETAAAVAAQLGVPLK